MSLHLFKNVLFFVSRLKPSWCSEYFFILFLRKSGEREGRFFLSTLFGGVSFQIFLFDFLFKSARRWSSFALIFNLRRKFARAYILRADKRERRTFANARSRKKEEQNVIYIPSDSNLDKKLSWEIRVNNNSSTRSWRKFSPPSSNATKT